MVEHHAFVIRPSIGKAVCKHCGLIKLNNPFSDWCVRNGCDAEDHPNYKTIRAQLTKKK